MDLGTGDGRAVLVRAAAEPRTLTVGIDAVAPAMREASLRAARPPARGGLPNAMFVLASVEAPPAELAGRVETMTILFPWGSLLRGALAVDERAAAGIASLPARNGLVTALVAPHASDGLSGVPTADELLEDPAALEERWQRFGMQVCELRTADPAEVAATRSTWARRLRAGERRSVVRFVLQRSG